MFCQYIYLWMYVTPAADLYDFCRPTCRAERVQLLLDNRLPATVPTVGVTIILLRPPLPAVDVSIGNGRGVSVKWQSRRRQAVPDVAEDCREVRADRGERRLQQHVLAHSCSRDSP